ncbi:MAG: Sec-independent protein translocase protein TatB [Brevirhabdus sp.]
MFDIGGTELLVVGVVALIVVGPKDLPGMFRTLGRFTAKIKSMAREFQTSMEAAADEAGVKDVTKDLKEFSSPTKFGMNKVTDAVKEFEKWTPDSSTQKGPETEKLSEERAEAARKIQEKSAQTAKDRLAREAAEADSADTVSDPALAAQQAADAVRKPAAKKPAAKKPAAKKAAAKKTAPKKAPATKTAARSKPSDKSKT